MTEQELIKLEHEYWQAIKDKDLPTLQRLTDDPCIVTGAQGAGKVDKKTYEQMMAGAKWSLLNFSLSEIQVLIPSDDVGLIAYRVHEEMDVEGQRMTLDAADASTWIHRDNKWVCSLHTESILGDPFGRDRSK